MSIRSARLFLLLSALAPVGLFASVQGGDQNTVDIPAHGTFRGLTFGEWTAEWWQAVLATPVEGGSHPLTTSGAVDGEKGVVFLAGPVEPAGSPTATSSITIPSGTPLFSPIVTVECSTFEPPPFHGDDEASLRTCANDLLDFVSDVSAEIDGRPANGTRVESPLFQWGPLPADNVFGAPEGTTSDAVAAGYVLMLPPLSVGVHHIAVRATIEAFGLAVDSEVTVTVVPR
jgi:hypothetical protein